MSAQLAPVEQPLDPARLTEPGYIRAIRTQVLSTANVSGDSRLEVRFPDLYSSVGRLVGVPLNWAAYNTLTFLVQNHENVPAKLGIRIDANPVQDWTTIRTYVWTVPANRTARVVIELNPPSIAGTGMRVGPSAITGSQLRIIEPNPLNLLTVYRWEFFLNEQATRRVTFSNMRIGAFTPNFSGIVDQFGQNANYTGPDKILAVEDMQANLQQELQDLAANPGPGGLQGTNQLPAQTATGRWRLTQLPSGKYYFVHPNGKLFWSFGMQGVTYSMRAVIENRLYMFQSLPPRTGEYGRHYSMGTTLGSSVPKECFDFHGYNQHRKFGADFDLTFPQRASTRLKSWGFNTLGPWWDINLPPMGEFPYTLLIRTTDFPTKLATPFDVWGALPDAFDAGFRAYVQTQVNQELVGHNGRTNFMGVFVDDELSWGTSDTLERRYAVAIAALRAPSTQPAKRAFIDSMKVRYRIIGNLNRDWGTAYSSWEAMEISRLFTLPASPTTALRRDLGEYVRRFANAYYSAVRTALKNAECTALYMGSRDAWYTPETTDVAAAYVDVISINRFGRDYTVDFSFATMKKPVMITSFSFGAMDRGHFSGGISQVLDQGSRADYFRNYVTAALQSPKVVGVHFFEFYDQPIVGRRYDGENYNQGFVRITDDPYTELVAVARQVGNALYLLRGQ